MTVLKDYSSLGMVLQTLLRQINFGSFLMVAARSIMLAIIFSAATSSTMAIHTLDFSAMSTKLFGYFCPDMLVLVLLLMLIDYFNDYARARSLGIAAQIKIMGEPSLVFTCVWFGFIQLSSEKYKIMS
jgi:hypothetical protein